MLLLLLPGAVRIDRRPLALRPPRDAAGRHVVPPAVVLVGAGGRRGDRVANAGVVRRVTASVVGNLCVCASCAKRYSAGPIRSTHVWGWEESE